MKTIFILFTLILTLNIVRAEKPELRLGLTINPLMSWTKSDGSAVESGKIKGGIEFGLFGDINFTPNYALSTGFTFSTLGGNLIYTDSVIFKNTGDIRFIDDVDVRFKLSYFNIPLLLKLKTNMIGRFIYNGTFGIITSFRIKARADISNGDKKIYENESIIKNDDTGVFPKSNALNMSMNIGGGFEYYFNQKTALTVGLFFNYGFLGIINDGLPDKVILHQLGVRVGIIF